mmetsp:Transcript_24048/g.58423  ORF Transcript_24048/g.58423 Transcript_24048/m.58423 type:complete len:281 (-) Transcript_24048:46-888(-)
MPEDDRVGNLHHGRLQMQRQQDVLLFAILDLTLVIRTQRLLAHESGIKDLCCLQLQVLLQRPCGPVGPLEDNVNSGLRVHDRGLLVCVEIAFGHVGNMGLRRGTPRAHLVGVLLCVVLHRNCCPSVRVAFAENGVDCAAEDLGVLGLDLPLLVILGILGEIRNGESKCLQLVDALLELRDRRRNVGQLNDIRSRLLGQLSQSTELIGHLLCQTLGEHGQHPSGNGNVLHGEVHPRGLREALHDGIERVGGQHGSLICVGPANLSVRSHAAWGQKTTMRNG